jgi:hypothetical protein
VRQGEFSPGECGVGGGAELFMNGKQKSSAASRESNFQIEFKLCGKRHEESGMFLKLI